MSCDCCQKIHKLELDKLMAPPQVKDALSGAFSDASHVILYGSKSKGVNINIFVVAGDESQREEITLKCFDVLRMGEKDFIYSLSAYDPMAMEPVLTGTVVSGDVSSFACHRCRLEQTFPDAKALDRMVDRAADGYVSAQEALSPGLYDTCGLLRALRQLSYAVSSLSYRQFYLAAEKFTNPRRHPVFKTMRSAGMLLVPALWEELDFFKGEVGRDPRSLAQAADNGYVPYAERYERVFKVFGDCGKAIWTSTLASKGDK